MRTSLNEIKLIEGHIFQSHTQGEAMLMEAKLLLDPGMGEKCFWQEQTYGVIRQYGRQKLKAEIEAVHQELFSSPIHKSFREKVWGLFFKP